MLDFSARPASLRLTPATGDCPPSARAVRREASTAALLVTGRDTEAELALTHDGGTGRWRVAGDARAAQLSASRAAILAALREAGAPMTPAQLAKTVGQRVGNVQALLRKMTGTEVSQPRRGWYSVSAELPTAHAAPPGMIDTIDMNAPGNVPAQRVPNVLSAPDHTDHIDRIGGAESSPSLPAANTSAATPPAAPTTDGAAGVPPAADLPCARCGSAIDHFTPDGEPRCALRLMGSGVQ